jgi:hypothetical protein
MKYREGKEKKREGREWKSEREKLPGLGLPDEESKKNQ